MKTLRNIKNPMKFFRPIFFLISCAILSACSGVPSKTKDIKQNTASSQKSTTVSKDSVWMSISKTNDALFQIRRGSFNIEKNEDNVPVASILGQVIGLKNNQVAFVKYYVPFEDCVKGFGSLYILNTDNTFLKKENFINGGETIASVHADIICTALKNAYQKAKNSISKQGGRRI